MKVSYVEIGKQFQEQKQELLPLIEKVLEGGQYILGPEVTEFEENFAKFCGVKHAVSVANGTDSLIISLKLLGIGPGDEVITTSNSWISSASSIALLGATPIFVDVKEDQNIDEELIQKSITKNTKAIMPIHLAGRPAEMDKINEIAKNHNLSVIEDAAQSIGSKYKGKFTGNLGDIGSFSLHPLKNLNGVGDGGMLTTNNDDYAKQIKLLRHHGLKNRNEVVRWGYNSRLDTLQAVILNYRLKKLNSVIEKRRQNAKFYIENLDKYVFIPKVSDNIFHSYHVFVIQTPFRDDLKNYLSDCKIETAIHYPIPIHLQEAALGLGYKKGSLINTEKQSLEILSLPLHQHLEIKQLEYVVEKIKTFLKAKV